MYFNIIYFGVKTPNYTAGDWLILNRHPLNHCGSQLDHFIYQDLFASYFTLSSIIQRQVVLWITLNCNITFNRTLTHLSRHPDALVMVTGDFNPISTLLISGS